MKIKYRHFSEPDVEKIYDTEKALKNNPCIHMTQEEFDQHELKQMEIDKIQSRILEYKIIKEENKP